jgi:DNA-binding response OmpR family regulator
VEDERDVANLVEVYLRREGFETRVCGSAEQAMEAEAEFPFDLVVLDINLPGLDGFEYLSALRTRSRAPVIILSARSRDEDMVLGLGIGADDYVVKPFSFKVLTARIRARLREPHGIFPDAPKKREVYRFGKYLLEADVPLLEKGEERVDLAPREIAALVFLVRNAGRSFSAKELYDRVWGNRYGSITTVAVHIQRIRRKIEEDPAEPRFIETVSGSGYRFNPKALRTGTESGE